MTISVIIIIILQYYYNNNVVSVHNIRILLCRVLPMGGKYNLII